LINYALNRHIRELCAQEATLSLGRIGSQSINLAPMIFEGKGIDGIKKINGRKR